MSNFDKNAPDLVYVRELLLWATNDGDLYRAAIAPYLANLARKEARETFDQFESMKGWRRIADEATRRYSVEMVGRPRPTLTICNKETRNALAGDLFEEYEELRLELAEEEIARLNFKQDQAALVSRFMSEIAPGIPAHDKPMMREAFHDWKDGLQRDGLISEYLCDNATLPANWH